MHFRCTFAPACDAAASRLRIASCLSPLPVLPFCGRRPPSGIEYPEMICYTCIDTIRISDADQSVFAEVPSMNDSRDFKKEYDAFLQKVPYQTAVVDDIKVRYQYGGMDGAPVILFFNGLEMQEMCMPYAERLGKKYRFLIYEYPFHTVQADEQIDFAAKLLKALSIDRVILIGASDGGVYAQIFAKRHPGSVSAMILTTTLTVDSDYVRDIQKERFSTPVFLLLLKLVPAKTEMKLLLKKSAGFLESESEEDRKYGRGFYETVASDLNYKRRFIHSFQCVYMLKDYPLFKERDFAYLRGKIQVLLPEKYRFSFRKKTCSKKRIRTALRSCSESWMRKFSMFRADTQASLFRQSAIWIGWKRFLRKMDPSGDLCEKKGCLMKNVRPIKQTRKNGAPEGAPFCIRFRDGRRVAFPRSAGSGGSGPPKRPLPPAAAAPAAAGRSRLPR